MPFEENLRNLRKNANMTQAELAEKLNVSRQAVSKWEKAVSIPDIENMLLLSKVFNVSVDELVDNKQKTISEDRSEDSNANIQSTKKNRWINAGVILVLIVLLLIVGQVFDISFSIFIYIMWGVIITLLYVVGKLIVSSVSKFSRKEREKKFETKK